jgi:predicted component of type VI protein secretion system
VSRQHCQLLVGLDDVRIRDLGSRNGTLVNGERVVGERFLNEGDQVQVGPLVFEICLDPAHGPTALPVSTRPKQEDTHSHCLDTKEMVSFDGSQQGQATEPAQADTPAKILIQS